MDLEMLGHMYALRAWMIAYAPNSKMTLPRVHEQFLIQAEIHNIVADKLMIRLLLFFPTFFLITKIFKGTFMKAGRDS